MANIQNMNAKFVRHQRRFFSLEPKRTVDNFTANKLIKDIHNKLIEERYNHKVQPSTASKQQNESISEIFDIYNQINEPRNYFIINTMLKVCFDLNVQSEISNLWKDIEILQNNNNRINHNSKDINISYSLLLKNCIQCNDIDISKCIQALKWMKNSNYILTTQNNAIIKLISKCNDIKSLKYVHSMLNDKLIQSSKSSSDIYIE
eukprot:91150_1